MKKTCLRGFRPGPTQRLQEARNFGFRKKKDSTIYVAKTKALISCAVIAQLICGFVFVYANSRFSHDAAQIVVHPEPKVLLLTQCHWWGLLFY